MNNSVANSTNALYQKTGDAVKRLGYEPSTPPLMGTQRMPVLPQSLHTTLPPMNSASQPGGAYNQSDDMEMRRRNGSMMGGGRSRRRRTRGGRSRRRRMRGVRAISFRGRSRRRRMRGGSRAFGGSMGGK